MAEMSHAVPERLQARIDSLVASAERPRPLDAEQREALRSRVKRLLEERDAVLIAHYYVDEQLQKLAEETGGHVSDSLDMADFGANHPASTLVIAGVRFMGETAKILSPEKRVLMPTLEAECSLDIGCPPEEFAHFCDQHPERTVVVYANTSAEVKARADWVVTSSNALAIVNHLEANGEKILWAPDRHLGRYIQRQTGADMLLWQGHCVVHDEFKAFELERLRAEHPGAEVLVHPESPEDVIAQADVVGSTRQLIEGARQSQADELIVATDYGIFYKMQQAVPGKRLIVAPTGGKSATCASCAHCPWMAMNGLENLAHCLETGAGEIHVDSGVREKALESLQRMLDFSRSQGLVTAGDA